MGLDCTAYEKIELTDEHEPSERSTDGKHAWCYVDDHIQIYDNGFTASMAGLLPGRCYLASGERFGWRAGSYGGYNTFRALLSNAAIGVSPEKVWRDPVAYQGAPFFELVNFSDCEGQIGPQACEALHADFTEHIDKLREAFGSADGYYQEKLDDWVRAFTIAAPHGLVDFH